MAFALALLLATSVPVGAATAAPTGTQLTGRIVIEARTTSSIDVVAARPFSSPDAIFAPRTNDFTASRPGSGFALIHQGGASVYPPVLVGASTPLGSTAKPFLFPFGTHPDGSDVFDHYRFPAGVYRLIVFTDGPTRLTLSLPGLSAGASSTIRPARRMVVPIQRLRAPAATIAGEVLGASIPVNVAERSILIQTVAARLPVSATGLQSFWCRYSTPPTDGRYLPRCLGGSGTGVGRVGPVTNFEYVGFNAFVHASDDASAAFSRSVEAAGRVEHQESLFIWLPI